jgi:phosphoglycerate-specific signal transduction histidine kinase
MKVEKLDRELLAETMKKAETELKRARDVLKRLRGFVTREKEERVLVNLLDLVRTEAARLNNEAMTRAVEIHIEPGSLPVVMADPVQIRQVVF